MDAPPLIQVAIALGLALVLSPALRGVTAEVNQTVGRTWPFSLSHCRTVATPGCEIEASYRMAGVVSGPIPRATR